MKPGRISCIVPFCRCTADARKFPGDTELICAKHWRAVSAETKARYRHVKRRAAKVWKLTHDSKVRRPGGEAIFRSQDAVQRTWARAKAEAIERAAGI